jgi:uncharacterized membrane protein
MAYFFTGFLVLALTAVLLFFTAIDALVLVFLTALPAALIGRSSKLPLSSTALRLSAGISLTREMIAACVSSID